MILDPKTMKLEDIAESARAIVEEGKDDDEFNNNSNELGPQSRAQQLKKLAIPEKKKLQIAKIKGFEKEIRRLFT
jgi:hypothetical protein